MHQNSFLFRPGLRPGPRWGSYEAFPDLVDRGAPQTLQRTMSLSSEHLYSNGIVHMHSGPLREPQFTSVLRERKCAENYNK